MWILVLIIRFVALAFIILEDYVVRFDLLDFDCVLKFVFIWLLVVNLFRVIMMFDRTLMVIMTFIIMPMLVGNSTGLKYSLQYQKENDSGNENGRNYSEVCFLRWICFRKDMNHSISNKGSKRQTKEELYGHFKACVWSDVITEHDSQSCKESNEGDSESGQESKAPSLRHRKKVLLFFLVLFFIRIWGLTHC